MLRGQRIRCATVSGTDQEKWERFYGTTAYGNLPQHKKHLHIGHKWARCPYDTECNDIRTEHMTGNFLDPHYDPDTYYSTITGTVPFTSAQKIEHYDDAEEKHVYMSTASRGTKWGFECTFSGCPYRNYHGKPYFYT